MYGIFTRLSISVTVALGLSTAAPAQWSIGQPGTREAPQGQHRYVYMVMSDPLPGKEAEYNDAYQNMHMGDLVQLPGWTGAQRFRLVPDVTPRHIQPLYRRGNLIIWDQEGADLGILQRDSRAAIAGGKSRLIPGFDYADGGSVRAIYQVIGPRVTRPDGRKPFIPDDADTKTPRPNRYIMLDFVAPAAAADAGFEAALSRRVSEVLALPGWMAAQRFRFATPPPGAAPQRLPFPKYLVIWETEGSTAQGLQDALAAATTAGRIAPLAADAATAQSSWWLPISPFITKDDFQR
jgi:hypothetical protein